MDAWVKQRESVNIRHMQQLRDQDHIRLKSPPQHLKSILKVRSPKEDSNVSHLEDRTFELEQDIEMD